MSDHPVAIITGASRGIGRTIAQGLALDGYRTLLVGRSRSSLDQVAETIWEQIRHNDALAPLVVPLDMTQLNSIDRTLGPVLEKLGRVDVLVNNAGQWIGGTLDIDYRDFESLLRINLTAQQAITKTIVPFMPKHGKGHIINVASRAGKVGFAGDGAYCASKFALVGFSESLYRELVPLGIKVTALCPGWVNTEMAVEAGASMTGQEMIQPEDLLHTVRWLLSLSANTCVKDVVLESRGSIT